MAENPRATPSVFRLALLLAVVGGYADAASYVLTKTFTGHITGNAVLFAVYLADAKWHEASTCAVAVLAFLAGILVAELAELGSGAGLTVNHPRDLRGPLAVEGFLLAAAIGCRWGWPGNAGAAACVMLACAALGVQNGALRRCGGVSVHTTFLTGMATSLVTSALRRTTGAANRRGEEDHTMGTLAAVWAAFVAGAALGAVLTARSGVWGLAGILVPMVIAGVWSCLG